MIENTDPSYRQTARFSRPPSRNQQVRVPYLGYISPLHLVTHCGESRGGGSSEAGEGSEDKKKKIKRNVGRKTRDEK